jgi:hypothetical protein
MKKLRICFCLLLFTLTVTAQPSVGLINTDITGPLGVGKRLMQLADTILNDSIDSTSNKSVQVLWQCRAEKVIKIKKEDPRTLLTKETCPFILQRKNKT